MVDIPEPGSLPATGQILLSRAHFPVTTLGPGQRLGIWFQGCSIRCPGCISGDTWGFDAGRQVSVAGLLAQLAPWLAVCDGVTISGGEPFDQPRALAEMLRLLHEQQRQHMDVLVFSGYPFETLQKSLALMPGWVDALVSDPFLVDASQTLALRGSDNQRLHLLTERGRSRFATYERLLRDEDRQVDVMFDAVGNGWLAGIPRKGDMLRLKALLSAAGGGVRVSEVPTGTHAWEK